MSSSRVVRSFHGTVFFGSPLTFLRIVKFFFRCNLFLEASQWACFVVASFSRPYFFGSSFRRLSYIRNSNKSTFPAFVARGLTHAKTKWRRALLPKLRIKVKNSTHLLPQANLGAGRGDRGHPFFFEILHYFYKIL